MTVPDNPGYRDEGMTWDGLKPPYRTIVADPPWGHYRNTAAPRIDPAGRYSTMGLHDILALPVDELADRSCHLWLWCTNGLMEDGYRVVRAWGFHPITVLTWCKPQLGVGHYLRNNTEHCILASRGRPMTPDVKPTSTWYAWDRSSHSAKPAAFFDIVEQVSPGPHVELFARAPRLGWDHWGRGYEAAS